MVTESWLISTLTSSFLTPGRSAEINSFPSRSATSTCGAHSEVPCGLPYPDCAPCPNSDGKKLGPNPKLSKSRSISSVMRRMVANGPPPYPPYGESAELPRRDASALPEGRCQPLPCE